MNGIQLIILLGALVVSALIAWNDLPIEFPGAMVKLIMLFVKLSAVLCLAIFGYIFASSKKKT